MLGTRPTYRPMLAIDIEKSSGRGDPAMIGNRATLRRALIAGLAAAGVQWDECHRTDLGDGFRLVLGREVPKADLLRSMVPVLAERLRAHNRSHGPAERIRVRVALHAGDVHMDDGEVVGGSLEVLARLLDAPPLRRALAGVPTGATVAVAVSQHIYEEVVRHGYDDIDPGTYRVVRFRLKGAPYEAWLHVPGYILPDDEGPADGDRAAADPGSEPARAGTGDGAQQVITNVAKGRARVKNQIGYVGTRIDHVAGDVSHGPPDSTREELWRLLVELRRALTEEREAGRVDPETYEAASDEIRAADQYLSTPVESDRSRLLLALRRLKGLVEDLADLAAKVTAVIAVARRL
jgi:hypothetical protein